MLNLNSIMIGTNQPDVLGAYYEKIFEKKPDMHEGTWYGWQVGSGYFSVGEHSEATGPAKEPFRIICNFETEDVAGEFERIKKTGATVVKEPYAPDEASGMQIATFADPDGNYFQLMSPWKEGK